MCTVFLVRLCVQKACEYSMFAINWQKKYTHYVMPLYSTANVRTTYFENVIIYAVYDTWLLFNFKTNTESNF